MLIAPVEDDESCLAYQLTVLILSLSASSWQGSPGREARAVWRECLVRRRIP